MANLYYQSGNLVLSINMFFSILKVNSNSMFYKEMNEVYTTLTRIIINTYLPSINYNFSTQPIPVFLTEEGFLAPKS